jgi:hypothetical protein
LFPSSPPSCSLVLLGLFTQVRLVDAAREDNDFLTGIARIRRYYRTLTPEATNNFAAERGRGYVPLPG